jgi:hypothetical protein
MPRTARGIPEDLLVYYNNIWSTVPITTLIRRAFKLLVRTYQGTIEAIISHVSSSDSGKPVWFLVLKRVATISSIIIFENRELLLLLLFYNFDYFTEKNKEGTCLYKFQESVRLILLEQINYFDCFTEGELLERFPNTRLVYNILLLLGPVNNCDCFT